MRLEEIRGEPKMPMNGLSLVGFLERNLAQIYFQQACILPSLALDYLDQEYDQARTKLGPPFPNAGQPSIEAIPAAYNTYLQGVLSNPRFPLSLMGITAWSFNLVEIDPILAFQFHVTEKAANSHGAGMSDPPTIQEMLTACLPQQVTGEQPIISIQASGLLIKSKDLNYRMMAVLNHAENPNDQININGALTGFGSNIVQVVRFDNRCFLRNGYHRAYSLRKAGATHMPCLLLDVDNFEGVMPGAGGGLSTFERSLLESPNPPTCGHFAQGRAYNVVLRAMARIIHVTWTDHVVADDM